MNPEAPERALPGGVPVTKFRARMEIAIIGIAALTLLTLIFASKEGLAQSSKENLIYYTGQIDGFRGSTANCMESQDYCKARIDKAVRELREQGLLAGNPSMCNPSILVSMGDNLAPDFNPPNLFTLEPSESLKFLAKKDRSRCDDVANGVFDAVV